MSHHPKFDAALAELQRAYDRPDRTIAQRIGCGPSTVARARVALVAAGVIPRRAGDRTAALRADPELLVVRPSVLATRHGLPRSSVSQIRREAQNAARLRELIG